MLKLIRARRKNGEKGQALVEFTLLVPVFLLLLFAIIDFGMGFYSWITVTNAAREGARLGAVLATQQEIEDRVYQTADLPDESTKMTVTVTNAQGQPGESVVVTVDYDYDLITPLAGIVNFVSGNTLGPTLTFSSTAEMRLE
ncbi:MAG TPA: TadE/TadG family type IV pilus assembly protein [Dehalococcoidia bacterium]|nr:TadE/TadG family type IV pilus assembly protein [Dehalococcoidia bacterium]